MIGWIYQSEKTVIKGDFEVVESTNDYSKDLAEVLFANQDKVERTFSQFVDENRSTKRSKGKDEQSTEWKGSLMNQESRTFPIRFFNQFKVQPR